MELLPFVKIFEINGGQFLVRKALNLQEECYEIILSISIKDGPDINFALKFLTLENRDRQFEDFTAALAELFLKQFEEYFQENPPDELTLELASYEKPVVEQRPLIVVAGDEEYNQIAEELSKHSRPDQQQHPLIIIP